MTPEELFLANLPLIKTLANETCRRLHLRKEEAEDFQAVVQDRIMADGYAVLRKFGERCSLRGYLKVVISRYGIDFLHRIRGKWRPSEMARRLGRVATLMDQLLSRDGYTFDQAVEMLQTNHKVEMSWQELNDIAVRLPLRTPPPKGEEVTESIPSSGDSPEARIVAQEKDALWARVLEALEKALKSLPAEDQVIIRMHRWDHFTIIQIAKVLKRDWKPLYKHVQKIQEHLRREMERQGIRKEDIDDLFDDDE
jgi:RNA polymerase sigma factor (sigma-70 family)